MRAAVGSPLTVSQRLIWTGQQLAPESPLYNMAVAFRIAGRIDVERFRAAFQALTDRCDALRTVFREVNGEPRQLALPSLRADVDVEDYTNWAAELEAELDRRARRVFRLDETLFESALFRTGEEQYVWYLNQHHLITDALGTQVLFRRMAELYQGSPVEMPAYGECVEHALQAEGAPQTTRAADHWRGGAAGRTAPRRIYGRKLEAADGKTLRVRRTLDGQRTQALRRLAQSPPFQALTRAQSDFLVVATLLLAWIHRVTDESALSVGVPSHLRGSTRFRETAGLFMEVFPLRAEIEVGESFASLARKAALAAQAVAVHGLTGASAQPGARDYSFVLNFIPATFGSFAGLPAKADWIHSGHGDPDHRMRLQVYDFDQSGELVLDFDLAESAFGEIEREWAVRHFLRLADALIADPEQPIAAVPLVTAEELDEIAPPGVRTEAPEDLMARIERRLAEGSSQPAVVHGQRQVSYAELGEMAARIAGATKAEGQVVGVCLPRSAELIAAWLGVLKAGGTYLPLDTAYPDARLRFMLQDAGAGAVITDAASSHRFAGLELEVIDIEEALRGQATAANGFGDPAYVLYTSGSTGAPKGVCVPRAALSHYVDWAARTYLEGRPASFAFFTSPAFDLTVTSVYTPLVCGGTVVVYGEEDGVAAVRRVFQENRCDVVKLTPSHLALALDLDLSGARARRLILGGEDLKAELAAEIQRSLGDSATIWNEYGPTETTVGCMIHRYDPAIDGGGSVSIGQPADNTRIYVLDEALRPLPRGARGQICIAGRGVAEGYWNHPKLTEERFVSDPFHPEERMYLSGDVGRWDASGRLQFVGRQDDQVKVQGVRVELGEVEAAIAAHPEVRACAVRLADVTTGHQTHCVRCGLEAVHPEAQLDEQDVCGTCRRYEAESLLVDSYFGEPDQLRRILAEAKARTTGPHDCLMLCSGGKDSTYALCKIVEMGARPLVFLLDNGYISEQAQANVRRVVEKLGLDLVIGTTPAMPAIFADSLRRFSNVCNGCFKTIYTLAMNLAHERGIRQIVTGLSRGQLVETRLAGLLRRKVFDPGQIDATILEARKTYHRVDDAVSRNLDVRIFRDDSVLDAIQFVDFYRYVDAPLHEVLDYISAHTPWIRPGDTGRSTNCRINEVGIYVHKMERGFHNYSEPYSWDVRLGHKTRGEALAELDDEIDVPAVRKILEAVGYQPRPRRRSAGLTAYYVGDRELSRAELRTFLSERLPRELVPASFVRLESMPLTLNGKVDHAGLPQSPPAPSIERVFMTPRDERERTLANLWAEVIGLDEVSIDADFFELGGDSMASIQIVRLAEHRGLFFSARDLFDHPTIRELAPTVRGAQEAAPRQVAPPDYGVSAEELQEVLDELGEA